MLDFSFRLSSIRRLQAWRSPAGLGGERELVDLEPQRGSGRRDCLGMTKPQVNSDLRFGWWS
ncbi:hypothetical protein [Nocardioides plantarum]|uniref:hypothetical protein n=1 Tax=Nocardioides plantarum TaxID=29299 RepID=UPI00360BE7D0